MRAHEPHDEPTDNTGPAKPLGVAIVSYNSGDVITDCLDSLLESDHPDLRIVICDNNSPDDTVATIRRWAAERACDFADVAIEEGAPPPQATLAHVTLLRSSLNRGFAAGTNVGLAALLAHPEIDLFWILNPDCIVTKGAARAYAATAAERPFSLMGGRTLYLEEPNQIQSDGGRISRWTGICRNVNQGLLPDKAHTPDPGRLDFISGANVVASRIFIETAGLMTEDYFLYFEEVDWATKRGDLALQFCRTALVYHHGGTSIGTGATNRRASGFANYFNYRNRMIFMRRHFPLASPVAYLHSMLKIFKLILLGAWDEAHGAICGLHQLAPPRAVRARLSPDAAVKAFGKGPTS